MKTVRWAMFASAVPMGQQLHEQRLMDALLASAGDRWAISALTVGSARSAGEPSRRLPLRIVWGAPLALASLLGTAVYGRVDLVHRLDLRLPPTHRREVVTIHDVAPLRFDDEGGLPHWAAKSAREADAVICPSAFAAAEVAELLGVERAMVVPNGVDLGIAEAALLSETELRGLGIEGRYVLHAGGATRRKNIAALAAAWPLVLGEAPDATLVLCGPPDPRRDRLFAGIDRTQVLGYRPRALVERLIRSAAAVVVPSTYEGFGLPALEALAAGTPVVAAARGALPEVCGDAAILVEPTADGIAGGTVEILAGRVDLERLREAGRLRASAFSWDAAAAATLRAYEQATA